jgi:hypothetical protein
MAVGTQRDHLLGVVQAAFREILDMVNFQDRVTGIGEVRGSSRQREPDQPAPGRNGAIEFIEELGVLAESAACSCSAGGDNPFRLLSAA